MFTLPEEFSWINKLKKYEGNPIIRPHGKLAADLIFNPAAVVHEGRVGLLCRCVNFEDKPMPEPDGTINNWSVSSLVWAWSDDGINFILDQEPFLKPDKDSPYRGGFEDPRICWIEDEQIWALTYTGVRNLENTPGLIAFSRDLVNWDFAGESFPERAVVITPKKINGRYYAYYGNSSLFSSWSEDLRTWHTENKPVLSPCAGSFDDMLCEAAVQPIISKDGILVLYNGAKRIKECPMYSYGYEYSVGWALFDKDDPEKLIARCDKPFLVPDCPVDYYGLSTYTVFSNGHVKFNGRHFLYYGSSDTRIGVAIEEV
jgi:predicted GH43/DUF377 family glycosyl hydrolase